MVVTSPANLGIPGALNLGLAHARGKYVARLDSDDLMMPRRLAEQTAVLDAHPEVVLVSCAYDIVDLEGTLLGTWKRDEPHEVTAFLLHFFNVVGGGGQVMFRLAEVLDEGGYTREYPSTEDYDLWARLARRGRIETLPFVGMTKRTHGNQSLARYAAVKRAHWTGIMRSSLEPFLRRAVRDDEIAALITVWRHDGTLGMAGTADDVMREAFARFRNENEDGALQAMRAEANRPAVVRRRAGPRIARSSARSDEVPRACSALAALTPPTQPPLLDRPWPRAGQRVVDRGDDFRPLLLVVIVAGKPAAALDLRQPRGDVGDQILAIVTRIEMHPCDRAIGEEGRGGDGVGDDQRDRVGETAVDDVAMQRSGERAAAFRDRDTVIVLLLRTLDAASATRVDADDGETFPALLHELAEGTKTSPEIVADFDEAASVFEMTHGLFLTGSPLKPALDLRPMRGCFPAPPREHGAQCNRAAAPRTGCVIVVRGSLHRLELDVSAWL